LLQVHWEKEELFLVQRKSATSAVKKVIARPPVFLFLFKCAKYSFIYFTASQAFPQPNYKKKTPSQLLKGKCKRHRQQQKVSLRGVNSCF